MRRARSGVVRRVCWAVGVTALLCGCAGGFTGDVAVRPGPSAADPVCARVVTALPDSVAGGARRTTTAQASAAWGGDDALVVLRCGVRRPGPSTQCVSVTDGGGTTVDWVVRPAGSGRVRYETYGRDPVVELTMPRRGAVLSAAPIDVGAAVALSPSSATCPS